VVASSSLSVSFEDADEDVGKMTWVWDPTPKEQKKKSQQYHHLVIDIPCDLYESCVLLDDDDDDEEEEEGEAWIERMIEDVGKMTWVYDPTPKEQQKKSQQYHHLVIDIPCDRDESCVLLDEEDDEEEEELEGEALLERMIEDVANMTWVYCPGNEEAEEETGKQDDQEEIHLVYPPREEGRGEEEDETTPQTCAAAENSQVFLFFREYSHAHFTFPQTFQTLEPCCFSFAKPNPVVNERNEMMQQRIAMFFGIYSLHSPSSFFLL